MTYSFNQAFTGLNANIISLLRKPLSEAAKTVIENTVLMNENVTQRDVLEALYLSVENGSVEHENLYLFTFSQLSKVQNGELVPKTELEEDEQSAWLWIEGATDVNTDANTFFSDYIRDQTVRQFELRYGKTITEEGLPVSAPSVQSSAIQNASDDIVLAFTRDILSLDENGNFVSQINDKNELPPIRRIGEYDAGGVASKVFSEDSSGFAIDGEGNYSPWAGTILFPFLGEGSFTREWLLNAGTSVFKKIPGTYDLISVAQTAADETNVLEALLNSVELANTINNNNIGRVATLALLAELRSEANDFYQGYYGLEDIGRFRIGGDLPLHAGVLSGTVSGAEFLFKPNYMVGTLGDDAALQGSQLQDIINAGLGDDIILASDLDDLIDGAEGQDTIDYSTAPQEVIVNIDSLELGHDARYIATVNKGTVSVGGSTDTREDLLYNIETIKGSDLEDEFNVSVMKDGIHLDGGLEDDTLDASALQTSVKFDLINGTLKQGSLTITHEGFEKFVGADVGNDVFVASFEENSFDGRGNTNISQGGYGNYNGSNLESVVHGDTADYSSVNDASLNVNLNDFATSVTLTSASQTLSANSATLTNSSSVVKTNILTDIENIFDTQGSDTIIGNAESNVFRFSGGNDVYEGRGGVDYFFLDKPGDNDTVLIDGGDGADFFYIEGKASEYAPVGVGHFVSKGGVGSIKIENVESQDKVIFVGDGSKVIHLTGGDNVTMPDGVGMADLRSGQPPGTANVTPLVNPNNGTTTVTVDFPIGPPIGITCMWPISEDITIYIDGIPTIWVNTDGQVYDFPSLDDIAGYIPDGTQHEVNFNQDHDDLFLDSRPVNILPDDDGWVFSNVVSSGSASSTYTAAMQVKDDVETQGSPLVLDLDMDGQIELTSLANSNVYWDIDEDGFSEHSGWVNADDGFLAIDLNGNGVIDGHDELFGTLTTDGFTELSILDSNTDGVINNLDTQFGDLLIWQDVNQNGVSGLSEVSSLADFNITSIDLNASTPTGLLIEGHEISHVSSFTVDDGVNPVTTHDIVDAWFNYDNINTLYNEAFTLDPRTFELPNLRGYGEIPTLQIAASIDNDTSDSDSLLSLVKDFASYDFASIFVDSDPVFSKITEILYRWSGADDVDPISRGGGTDGGGVDAQQVYFLEQMIGETIGVLFNAPLPVGGVEAHRAYYLEHLDPQNNGIPILGELQGGRVGELFDTILNKLSASLIAQIVKHDLFEGNVSYNASSDVFEGITGLSQNGLNALLTQSLNGQQVADKVGFWMGVINTIDQAVGVSNLSTVSYNALEVTLQASDSTLTIADVQARIQHGIDKNFYFDGVPGDDVLSGTSGNDLFQGGIGDESYSAGYGDDTLSGGIGNDVLDGSTGNDLLNGQLGDDLLKGGVGNDTYLYELGHGNDTFLEAGGQDTIIFGAGITLNDLTISRVGIYDVKIEIDPTVGSGSIFIENQIGHNGALEMLEFHDGSTFDMNTIDHTNIGTLGDDVLYGVGVNHGGTGNDTIYGFEGNDSLYGYAIVGGTDGATQNTLYGGLGDDFLFGDHGNDMLYGEEGNDDLSGSHGDDLLNGGVGDDIVKGDTGSDTYIFNYGDGDDVFDETAGDTASDKIVFGEGITLDMIGVSREINGDLVLDVDDGLGGSVTIASQINGSSRYVIEEFEFFDGTIVSNFDEYTVHGLEAAETIRGAGVGGSGVDIIYGHGGNDSIYGYWDSSSENSLENFLYGGAGSDIIKGGIGIDTIDGGSENDTLHGYAGDDLITGGSGDDYIYAGDGHDTAIFSGHYADYEIVGNVITDTVGTDGSDTLSSIERYQFADGIYENGIFTTHPHPDSLVFSSADFSSYGGQDVTAQNAFSNELGFELNGNTWRKADFDYTVTEDTILSFEYLLNVEGEIHSIGVDFDDDFSNGNEVLFKLDGTQSSSILNYDYNNGYVGDGSEYVTYNIRLGDYFSGNVNYMTFANDHDVTNPDANSAFKNIRVFEKTHDFITLDSAAFGAYASNINNNLDQHISLDGLSVNIGGDTWQSAHYDYTVTENTVLEFNFSSTTSGEIHALGVDNDLYFNNNDEHYFTLGSLNSTVFNNDFKGYEVGDGTVKYTIRLGDYHTGDINYLTFINDHDGGNQDANSTYSNIKFYEADHDYMLFSETNFHHYNSSTPSSQFKALTHDALTVYFNTDTWQHMLHEYNVTADTILEFDFRSTAEGVIHAIGVDTDTYFGSSDTQFLLSGSSSSTLFNRDLDEYDGSGSDVHYAIRLGDYVTGNINFITFINDFNEADPLASGDSIYSNMRLYDTTGDANDNDIKGSTLDDTLLGAAGDDTLDGAMGDDILYGQDGLDTLIGGLGADTFVFEATSAFNDVDVVSDFNVAEGDALDLSELLSGYDATQDAISDFIQITDNGTGTTVSVDADGGADAFVQIATLTGVTGLTDENALEIAGNLITV